jgi:hypothetical protein
MCIRAAMPVVATVVALIGIFVLVIGIPDPEKVLRLAVVLSPERHMPFDVAPWFINVNQMPDKMHASHCRKFSAVVGVPFVKAVGESEFFPFARFYCSNERHIAWKASFRGHQEDRVSIARYQLQSDMTFGNITRGAPDICNDVCYIDRSLLWIADQRKRMSEYQSGTVGSTELASAQPHLSSGSFGHLESNAFRSDEKIALRPSDEDQQASEHHKPVGIARNRLISGGVFGWLSNDPIGGFVVGLMIGAAALGVGALIGTMPKKQKANKNQNRTKSR